MSDLSSDSGLQVQSIAGDGETTARSRETGTVPRSVGGPWVVGGMLLFAASVVAGFWIYWGLSNRPFRGLQAAILAEFPATVPQVAGGVEQLRGESGPMTLRLVVRTLDFDPNAEPARAAAMADRLHLIAAASVDLDDYRRLETVLFHKYQESRGAYWTRVVTLPDGDQSPHTTR